MCISKSFFRIFTSLLILLLVVNMITICAFAEGYKNIEGYDISETVKDVSTLSDYQWQLEDDGSLVSGNKGQSSTRSVLKVTVVGSGALTYQYKVSSPDMGTSGKENTETNPDSLIVWQTKEANGEDFLAAIKDKFSPDGYAVDRFYGEIDWTSAALPTDAEETETTEYYFIFKKNGSRSSRSDCAWIKNIRFSTGKISFELLSSDSTLGTVSGETEYYAGDKATVVAAPKDGCKFYGWNMNGRIVSEEKEYMFTVGEDMTLTAIFGREDTVAAQNIITGYVYDSVGDALSDACSGETVILLANASVEDAVTVPENVTLYIPYSEDFDEDGCCDGTTANRTNLATTQNTFRCLTVEEGASVEVKGVLRIGGVIGFPSQNYQGHTSGSHGRIINKGKINIAPGGILDVYGFIDGNGTVTSENGAKVYEPFMVLDFSGGSNTLKLNTAGQSPFAQYSMQNIRCSFLIESGSLLIGRCNLYASGEFNKTDAIIVGDTATKGILSLKDGAVLTRTVDMDKSFSNYCSDLGRVKYSIDGGADFNYLEMEVLGVYVSTENILFPIPFCYEYVLSNGIYDINTDLVLMPGSTMTVEFDAAMKVHDRFFVLNGLLQNVLSGKRYPDTASLQAAGYSASGELIVNGTLAIDPRVPFGGIVQTKRLGAQIITEKSTAENDPFSNSVTIGATAAYGDNTTVLPLEACVRDGDSLTKISAGKRYSSAGIADWILPSYTVSSYTTGNDLASIVKHGPEDVTVNQVMYGSFSETEDTRKIGDINGDGIINAIDTTRLAKYLAGILTLDNKERAAADINGDGIINAIDTTRLAKYLAGILTSL